MEVSHSNTVWLGYKAAFCVEYSIRGPSILWKRNSLSLPWYFPEKVPKFNEKYFLIEVCYIHKSHHNQSVNEHNLDTWHKTHIPQTGENLSLLGHCHKFPEFSLIFGIFPKFPEFSLTGKLETHFQGFPWFPEWLGTLSIGGVNMGE